MICEYDEYIKKQKNILDRSNKFESDYISGKIINKRNNEDMFKKLTSNSGFIR